MHRVTHLLVALVLGAGLAPAHAWKGDAGGPVHPIAEVNEMAEEGDIVTVEGEVVEVSSGPGSLRLAVVEDETGQVMVAVAEHLRRNIEREAGEDPIGVRVRVSGRWDHGYLKQDRWAIRATSVERIPSP
jgi:RecJ-like exonuclease